MDKFCFHAIEIISFLLFLTPTTDLSIINVYSYYMHLAAK